MVIIDTSVAYKWFDKEEVDSSTAIEILNLYFNGQIQILVPDLIIYELGNVWATKTKLDMEEIKVNLAYFKKCKFDIIPVNFDLMEKAIELSKENKISVYDASYIVLAREKRCSLVTADAKLVDKVNLPFVVKLQDYEV